MNQTPNNNKTPNQNFGKSYLSKDLKDYYSPAAIRKTEEAIRFLEKVGLPEELLKIRDAQYPKK
jgi:hypothetical protein